MLRTTTLFVEKSIGTCIGTTNGMLVMLRSSLYIRTQDLIVKLYNGEIIVQHFIYNRVKFDHKSPTPHLDLPTICSVTTSYNSDLKL